MTKNLSRSLCECLEMLLQIGEQQLKRAAMMIMGHDPSRDSPEPFNAVGVGIISRRIHQMQMLLQFSEHRAHEQRASRGVCLQVVSNHDSHTPPLPATSHACTHLRTK